MALERFTNGLSFNLASTLTNVATTLTPPSYTGWPSTGQFVLLIESELILITDASTHPWPISRAQETTVAATHASGIAAYQRITAGSLSRLLGVNDHGSFYLGTQELDFAGAGVVVSTSGSKVVLTFAGATASTTRLLNYTLAVDITAAAVASNTWTDVIADQSFTVANSASNIEASIFGFVQLISSTGSPTDQGIRAVIDSSGTPQYIMIGGGVGDSSEGAANTILTGGVLVNLGTLSAGSHTIKLQVYNTGTTAAIYCRPATIPNCESLSIQIMERH